MQKSSTVAVHSAGLYPTVIAVGAAGYRLAARRWRDARRLGITSTGRLMSAALLTLTIATASGCGNKAANDSAKDEKNGNPQAVAASDASTAGSTTAAKTATKQFTAAECRELMSLRTTALGLLENEKTGPARDALAKLAEKLPNDPFVTRNRLVCEYLLLIADRTNPAVSVPAAPSADDLEKFVRAAKTAEPDSAVPHVLAAWIAAHGKKLDAAVAELILATKSAPNAADVWFQLYDHCARNELKTATIAAGLDGKPVAARELARTAILKVLDLQPDNLAAYKRLFDLWPEAGTPRQPAAALSEADAAEVQRRLDAYTKALEPLAPFILKVTRADLNKLIQQARDQWTAGNRPMFRARLIAIDNVIKAHDWVRSDRRLIERTNALSFVRSDLASEICPVESTTAEPSTVSFAPAADNAKLPAVTAPSAAKFVDFRLTGALDLLVAHDAGITVLGRDRATGAWSTICTVDVPGDWQGILAADLDKDTKGDSAGKVRGSGSATGDGPVKSQSKNPAPAGANTAAEPATADPKAPQQPGNTTAAAPKDATAAVPKTEKPGCQDNDPDLVLWGVSGIRVFRNEPTADANGFELKPIPQSPEFDAVSNVFTATLIDVDHEGDLDLMFSTPDGVEVWLNTGTGEFVSVTGLSPKLPGGITSMSVCDWDGDVDLDVVVTGKGTAGVLENLRHYTFRYIPFDGELANHKGVNASTVADVDSNGGWDILSAVQAGLYLARTRAAAGIPTALDVKTHGAGTAVGLLVGDLDNDSLEDVLLYGPNGVDVMLANSTGQFLMVDSAVTGPARPTALHMDIGDVDRDGDLDIVVTEPTSVQLFINEQKSGNSYSTVRVRGELEHVGGHVNSEGLGSTLELRSGELYRRQRVTSQETHFGLGKRSSIDAVRVLWTNGIPQNAIRPPLNAMICEEQFQTTSCPFLYTWDGTKFRYETDLLWGAPLGLQSADNVIVPWRAWEYIKISGDHLQPKDGQYVLQFTEELWEAGYFDQVQLVCVDHPRDVAVFSNEKVGPPDLAAFKVHTAKIPILPTAARDSSGRDCLAELTTADEVYAKCFPGFSRRGRVEEHYLELEFKNLPTLDASTPITLFLTGWIYPAPTSVNVGMSQNPAEPRMHMPSLSVPNAAGEWTVVRPWMGFPGGKPKTVAIDLTGLFTGNDYRLRIATNVEFYWDAAFVTCNESPAEVKLTHLNPVAANLHYRGFSQRLTQPNNAPDTFLYNVRAAAPAWSPMTGNFTRYGDVLPLLLKRDDQLAVLATGDEMTVSFAVPDAPPEGWTRDFLLYNVGWDKDCDLHVFHGQSSEPLPFHAMQQYPAGENDTPPDSPEYQSYLDTWQTRTCDPRRFHRWLRTVEDPTVETVHDVTTTPKPAR